ncbi:nucleotidyltransferase domain-containing protein [uncultured Imperialibacter sp.]|uniref:nucleotidyltransferase family protein n=1 Tax=uncultured Imperialibacter sp. TaxID=1672639 RepID=UPI0030DABA6B|tara:strand:- start:26547 stop:26870 length:324 start_codon:yes stop_codon:yes gene_type:complete
MKIIKDHINEISTLCKKHKVIELFAFGSILSDSFDADSDVDFLVKFGDVNLADYFDNYMNLKESLESLLNRKVDLLEVQTLRNPILIKSINRTKALVYGRKGTEVAI